MSDATLLTIVGLIVGCVQGISTAWLNRAIKQNACGGARCADVIQRQTSGGKDAKRADRS